MNYTKVSSTEIVEIEAKRLGLRATPDVVRYIIALAESELEYEVSILWESGQRPEGTYEERFIKAVVVALKEHQQVLEQIGGLTR
jgi:hypothetical protein